MNKALVISVAIVLAFLLYFPVLGNGFLTDDYAALYRILVEKRILYRDMLRPLIDISFYLNYLVSGLHPFGYYVFNFLVHAMNCYLVYLIASRMTLFEDRRQTYFALLSGLAFALYPFHSEPVVWLSGRLSSIAAAAALWAIYVALCRKGPWDWVGPALLWIAGLFAYESIIGLPLIILVLRFSGWRRFLREASIWAGVGIFWLLLHYVLAGSMLPDYGRTSLVKQGSGGLGMQALKVLGRCFLPPAGDRPDWMTKAFVGVGVVVVAVGVVVLMRRPAKMFKVGCGKVIAAFLIALVVPVMIGVSTRTSEGDRLLYFPSVFLCLAFVAALLQLTRRRLVWLAAAVFFGGVGVFLIETNNGNWVTASETAAAITDSIRGGGKVVFVNLPDEWEGAYIFRNNIEQSMMINGIDTSDLFVSNKIMRPDYLKARFFQMDKRGDSVEIAPVASVIDKGDPVTWIIRKGDSIEVNNVGAGTRRVLPFQGTRIYYWSKFDVKRVNL